MDLQIWNVLLTCSPSHGKSLTLSFVDNWRRCLSGGWGGCVVVVVMVVVCGGGGMTCVFNCLQGLKAYLKAPLILLKGSLGPKRFSHS